MNANDKLHQEALDALKRMSGAKSKAQDYDTRRKEATARFGEVASRIWEALERGESVGGMTKKENWCAVVGVRMRWTQTAIERFRNPDKSKAQSVRVVTIKGGDVVNVKRWDGEKWFIEKCEVSDNGKNGISLIKIKEESATPKPAKKETHFELGCDDALLEGAEVVESNPTCGKCKRRVAADRRSKIAQIKRTSYGERRRKELAELGVVEGTPTPKKKVKRYSTKVPSGDFITMPAKPHKTHKMSNDGRRTWCGKTPGDTLAKDARMSDEPTCRGCQSGEQRDLDRINYMKKQPVETDETVYTETCMTCGAQRTKGEDSPIVTIPRSGNAFNGARVHCKNCGTKASAYNRRKFTDKPVGWVPTGNLPPERPVKSAKKKTHAIGTTAGDVVKWTVCGKAIHQAEPGEINIAADGEKPTCGTCLKHRSYRFGKFKTAEVSESAQALADATAAADVPTNIAPEILNAIKSQKQRIAVGLHPVSSACPNAEEEVL
jgi:hypothetical protein